MAMPDYESVDAYLAAQREDVRALLCSVRDAITRAVPAAEETISYKIPTYRLHGRPLVFFAAWKAHLSLYPATARVFAAIPALAPFKHAKDTVQLRYDAELPLALIKRFAQVRAAEIEAEHGAPAAKKPAAKKPAAKKPAAKKPAAKKPAAKKPAAKKVGR